MTLTVVVTRNIPPRVRGFLRSVMLEISATTFVSTILTRRARDQIWAELEPFGSDEISILMIGENANLETGYQLRTTGEPQRDLIVVNGLLLSGFLDKSDS